MGLHQQEEENQALLKVNTQLLEEVGDSVSSLLPGFMKIYGRHCDVTNKICQNLGQIEKEHILQVCKRFGGTLERWARHPGGVTSDREGRQLLRGAGGLEHWLPTSKDGDFGLGASTFRAP